MNLFSVSVGAFQRHRNAVEAVIAQMCEREGTVFLKVDETAARGIVAPPTTSSPVVEFSSLVRQWGGDYMPDEQAIAECLGAHGSDSVLLIDASAFSYPVITRVTSHMRQVLFSQPTWPRAIAIVLREELLDASVNDMAAEFYLLPSRKSQREASAYAYRVHKVATFARLMQWSHGATGRAFVMRDRLRQRFNRFFKRDEADLV